MKHSLSSRLAAALSILALGALPVLGAEDDDDPADWDVSSPPGDWQTIVVDTDETTWSTVTVAPDGRSFVFDMLGDLYSVPIAGGEARALTEGIAWDFQPTFSPDGSTIAFVSDRAGADNLWLIDADGDIGSLEAGKLADLAVIDGNPLELEEGGDTVPEETAAAMRAEAERHHWVH